MMNDGKINSEQWSAKQIDMLAGISAGMVSTLISHPLDTVKVRI